MRAGWLLVACLILSGCALLQGPDQPPPAEEVEEPAVKEEPAPEPVEEEAAPVVEEEPEPEPEQVPAEEEKAPPAIEMEPVPEGPDKAEEEAAKELEKAGTDPGGAIPRLIEIFRKNSKPGICGGPGCFELVDIGKRAVPALIELLKTAEPHVQKNAAFALAMIGEEARPAVPVLIQGLSDSDLAGQYILTLEAIKPASRWAPDIIQTLKSEEGLVRESAYKILVGMGKDAVPALTEALEDENEQVRQGAQQALEKIQGK